jgi:hypothetical protein
MLENNGDLSIMRIQQELGELRTCQVSARFNDTPLCWATARQ